MAALRTYPVNTGHSPVALRFTLSSSLPFSSLEFGHFLKTMTGARKKQPTKLSIIPVKQAKIRPKIVQ